MGYEHSEAETQKTYEAISVESNVRAVKFLRIHSRPASLRLSVRLVTQLMELLKEEDFRERSLSKINRLHCNRSSVFEVKSERADGE